LGDKVVWVVGESLCNIAWDCPAIDFGYLRKSGGDRVTVVGIRACRETLEDDPSRSAAE
jgi:predicted NUDIX family NTP pyrophosphohydrolase